MNRLNRALLPVLCCVSLSGCLVTGEEAILPDSDPGSQCRCDGGLSVAQAQPADHAAATGSPGDRIDIRIPREPTGLLPIVEGDPLVDNLVYGTVLERLVRISGREQSIVPELAERFEVDEENNRYVFYLDDEAEWHDGRPVTAEDVVFVFSKLADPHRSSGGNRLFSSIRRIQQLDHNTVLIELDRFMPGFLFAVASVPILPSHVFGRTPLARHAASRAPIGSGPFRFVRWEPSRLIELERNPNWRGPAPGVDQLVYHVVPDDRIAMDMFNHGHLDIVLGLPVGSDFSSPRGRRITYPQPFVDALVYNLARPLFAETATRQALAMLLDEETLRCSVLGCLADLPQEIETEGRLGRALPTLPFRPDRAAQVLTEAGWVDSDGDGVRDRDGTPFSFSLLIPNRGKDLERTVVAIQSDLAAAGIAMRISTVSRSAFYGRLAASRFDAAVLGVELGPRFDAWSLYHTPRGPSSNVGGFSNRRIDALLEAWRASETSGVKTRLLDDLRTALTRQQPLTFMFRPYSAALVRSTVGGVRFENGWFDETALFVKERREP